MNEFVRSNLYQRASVYGSPLRMVGVVMVQTTIVSDDRRRELYMFAAVAGSKHNWTTEPRPGAAPG